jgi:hypothetical protein
MAAVVMVMTTAMVPVRVLRIAVAPEVTLTPDGGDERDETDGSEDDPEHGERFLSDERTLVNMARACEGTARAIIKKC